MAYQTLSLGLTLTIPTSGTRNWGSTLLATTWTQISQHQHTASGDGNQLVTGSYTDYSVTGIKLSKNIYVTQATTLTPVGTTQTVNFNLGNVQKLDTGSASGDVTLTFSNPSTGGTYTLFIIQGVTSRLITFPATVKWPQGQAPILSTANGSIDKITFYYDGTNYYGDWEVAYA